MANIKSQKKRALTNLKRQNARAGQKSELKTAVKKVQAAVAEGNKSKAEETFKVAVKKVDQACTKGVIKPNTASRKKSALAKKLNSLK